MRRIAVMIGMLGLFVRAAWAAGAVDLELPRSDGFLAWNSKERKFTAAIESAPLKKVMAKVGAATGWKVYIDPAAEHTVSAQFTNRTSGEALRMLLGGLNFAVVPEKDGPSKLLVFQNRARDATEFVEPAKKAESKDRIKNELLVSLIRGSKRNIDDLAKMLGAKVIGRNDRLRSYRLQFDSEDAVQNARDQLAAAPDVRVDDNYYVHAPDEPGYQTAGGPAQFNLSPDVDPDACHPIVAVVDTAVQPLSAQKSAFMLPPVDIAGATSPQKMASEVPLHGTSMVETILNSMAVTAQGQTNSGAKILPINVYGDNETTSTYEVTMGVYEAVRRGASIVNMSLGGDGDSPLLDDLIAQARARGVMFFAAAGNTPTTAPTFPAANPDVFAVTAGNRDGSIADYANRGNFIDMIAPGTAYMDYNGTTFRVVGTSPATAIVSGAAATFSANCLGQAQTIQQLQQTFGFRPK